MSQVFLVVSNPNSDFAKEAEQLFTSRDDVSFYQTNKKPDELGDLFEDKKPTVLIMGPDWNSKEALVSIKEFGISHPHVQVLLVANKLDKKLLQNSFKAGVKDLLEIPLDPSSMMSSFDTAAKYSASILNIMDFKPKANPKKKAKIITLFSTKGGVGKTVIATNLAASLSMQNKKTFIVDLDLQFGDVAVMLGIEPKHSIYEAVQAGDYLDSEMLGRFACIHEKSNLKALLAPVRPNAAQAIGSNHIEKIINLLQESCDYIVIDTPASMDSEILKIVNMADKALLVATMDLPSIKNAKIAYGILNELNVPKNKIGLLLNRSDSKVGLNVPDVEKAIGCRVFASIPSDRLIPRSVNEGVPCIINSPRSDVGRSLLSLSKNLLKSMQ